VQDELGNMTNISYLSPTVMESTFNFNSGNSTLDTRTTLDGLGRTHIVQRRQSPTATNYDSVETDYDSYGRPSRVTVPYVAAAGITNSSAPATTTAYDALSRPTTVTSPPQASDSQSGTVNYNYYDNNVLIKTGPAPNTQRQYEYDALGRLISVCELTSGTGSGNCAQNTTPRSVIGQPTPMTLPGIC